jgi:putative FmdB family regulatory protein
VPIYTYECRCGRKKEVFHKINRVPNTARCECGWLAKKILSPPAIQCDSITDVKWLESAKATLPRQDRHKIDTKGKLNSYLKEKHLECIG